METVAVAASGAGDASLPGPLPFVTLTDDGNFEIAPEAMAYLQRLKGDLAVVAIAGLYRTGKSYLLNLLLGREHAEEMFNVGATVNACTKGIWIWGQPLTREARQHAAFKHLREDTTVLFMDTEGLGSTQRSQTQDTRIFALALLLSSLFIYNSRGVIDSNSIEDLSLVVNLTKLIQAKAGQSGSDSEGSELSAFFPDFLWVVRDFALQLEEDGRKVTPREYFESALKQQPPMNEEIVQKNRIRSLLSTFFPARDCVTMVRPVSDEALLRDLIKQPYESLRPEFRQQMDALKNKVYTTLKPKKVMAKALNGPMLVALAENYVEAFNSGSSPVISTVWDRVLESQCDQALENAKAAFKTSLETAIAEKTGPFMVNQSMRSRPLEDAGLTSIYEEARRVAEQELTHEDISSYASVETYFLQLSEYMLETLQAKYEENDALSSSYNKRLVKELYKPKEESLTSPTFASDDGTQYLQDQLAASRNALEEVVTKYKLQSIGSSKSAVLSNFLAEKIMDGLFEWSTLVKTLYRAKTSKLEEDIASTQQALRGVEGKVRVAQEMMEKQKASYDQALRSIAERTTSEGNSLRDEIESKQAEIDRTRLQIERLSAIHKEALDRLDSQIDETKEERKRLEIDAQEAEARRENERQEAQRQMLESERNFHREEKGLIQNQHKLLQQVLELERQLGEQDTEQMKEAFRLEKENQHEESQLTVQHQDEQEELKERMLQDIRKVKQEQDTELAALQSEVDDSKALLSSLREKLQAKEAAALKKAKAEECVVQ